MPTDTDDMRAPFAFAYGPEPESCPQCDGPPCYLGTLGKLTWLRCRHCGYDWTLTVTKGHHDEDAF